MEYAQIKSPNLGISEDAGWCLRFTERSFGVPLVYPSAWEAWEATEFKHLDRDFPNAAVPVWFDWTGDVGSGKQRYGHVAYRSPDGVIHSAPGVGQGSITFNSVDELTQYFGNGMTYVGWSEDIAGVKVIEGEEMEYFDSEEQLAWTAREIYGVEPQKDWLTNTLASKQSYKTITERMKRYAVDAGISYPAYKESHPMTEDDSQKRLKALQDALNDILKG